MVKIKCSNEKCGHEWNYLGKSKILATCSSCGLKTKFLDNKIEDKSNGDQ